MLADGDALAAVLSEAPGLVMLAASDLEPLPDKGVAHRHLRLRRHGLVVRLPRWSQMGLEAARHLELQAAAFQRAAAGGHVPALHGVIAPCPSCPRGALLVADVSGRPPRLPQDLPVIACALAALHRLPVPPTEERAPLPAPARPVLAALAQVEHQFAWFHGAGLAPHSLRTLEGELVRVRAEIAQTLNRHLEPVALVGIDTHPGNFLVDARGHGWFVDLEKAQYGSPAMDLAHTVLPTSTTWDADCAAVLTAGDVATFLHAWTAAVPEALARAVTPWLHPLRRLTWLRSLSWMAHWLTDSDAAFGRALPPAVRTHFVTRAACALSPEGIAGVLAFLEG